MVGRQRRRSSLLGMKCRRDMRSKFFPTGSSDELSGTTKIQRERWWAAFWQYLDRNPGVGQLVHGWQQAGCDPRNIAVAIHRFVTGCSNKLHADRKKRKKITLKILAAAIRSLQDLEELDRIYEQHPEADRIAVERKLLEERLSRVKFAFDTKRLGTSRSWTDLAMVEGFVFEVTGRPPSAREIVCLIKAGRHTAGQLSDSWKMDPVIIAKGLRNFKKNNPLEFGLWTKPSLLP
jgi:hypothetical protein